MGATNLKCRSAAPSTTLEARYVCERCFGPLEVAYDHTRPDDRRRRAAPPHPGRAAEHLALRRLPAARRPARPVRPRILARRPAGRLHAADPRRPARRAPRACGEVWVKNDAANPTHSFKDRVVSVAAARARELGFDDARLRLDRQPRQLGRRPRRGARAGDLRLHPVRPRGAEDPRDRRLRHEPRQGQRQLRRRQPPLHRALAASATGRSSTSTCARTTPRAPRRSPTRSPSSSAGRLPDRIVAPIASGSLFTKIAKGFEEWLDLGLIDGDAADDERRAGRRAARRSRRPSPPATTSAARSSRTRSPSRWRSATRPTARTRSSSRARSGGSIDAVTDDEIRAGHPPAGRDDRHLHRDRRRRDHRDARQARRARRRSAATSASCSSSPARA